MSLLSKIQKKVFFPRSNSKEAEKDESVFTEKDLRSRERYRKDYEVLSASIMDLVPFKTVLDIGCANGFLITPFFRAGRVVRGVEISEDAAKVLPSDVLPFVQFGDAIEFGVLGSFDLVTCVEVIEHIPPLNTVSMLDVICNNAKSWVYFTAASPYQPGHGHINMRPFFYYLNEFAKRGFELDFDKTQSLLSRIEGFQNAPWLYNNSLIFKRV